MYVCVYTQMKISKMDSYIICGIKEEPQGTLFAEGVYGRAIFLNISDNTFKPTLSLK